MEGKACNPRGNLLVACLSPRLRARRERSVTEVSLKSQQVLVEAATEARDVYFPETSVLSVVAQVADGQSVAAAVIGNEGMAGLSVFQTNPSLRTVVQIGGNAVKMPSAAFIDYFDDPEFRQAMSSY